MNEPLRSGHGRHTTQGAKGVPRWRWTTAELLGLTQMGAFVPEGRFELIGGEIVSMSPAGWRPKVLREAFERAWHKRETADFAVVSERQFHLTDEAYTKPDVLVRPFGIRSPDMRGDTAVLVVEVADSSLEYDQTTKANLHEAHGVREYWVVHARTLETRVHREAATGDFGYVFPVCGPDRLEPLLVPHLAVCLGGLNLDG